jgi:hypothetical protein
MGAENQDTVQSLSAQAGSQMHFRLSRGRSQCAGNLYARDFLITPYNFGIALEYPGWLEAWNQNFSVHSNHQSCGLPYNQSIYPAASSVAYLDDASCGAAGHLWVGDVDDAGGLFVSAYDGGLTGGNSPINRANSFVLLASDTFSGPHGSHGDMLFAVRDYLDNFRFQFGPSGPNQADDPNTYKSFTRVRFDSTGKGYFDGGVQTGGADFAESVAVTGDRQKYEVGDVLTIDTSSDRRLSLSAERYSTLVAGVYSEKPGLLGTKHGIEDSLESEVPLAVVGIVPCKVSAENGPIRRGDLLVTSSTPGYAMKATDRGRFVGAILGKAMQSLNADKGKIDVLITLN